MKKLVGLAILGLVTAQAMAVTIDFDNVAAGTVITNQYPDAIFSSNAGQENRAEAQNLGSSLPNFLCTFTIGGGINCVNDTYVDFINPVNGLSFLSIGADDTGHNADVNVFVNNAFAATVQVVGDGTPLAPDLVDLTAFNNVTRIEIVGITDSNGLGWDDFRFNVVPEPFSLVAVGGAVLAMARRRKSSK